MFSGFPSPFSRLCVRWLTMILLIITITTGDPVVIVMELWTHVRYHYHMMTVRWYFFPECPLIGWKVSDTYFHNQWQGYSHIRNVDYCTDPYNIPLLLMTFIYICKFPHKELWQAKVLSICAPRTTGPPPPPIFFFHQVRVLGKARVDKVRVNNGSSL